MTRSKQTCRRLVVVVLGAVPAEKLSAAALSHHLTEEAIGLA